MIRLGLRLSVAGGREALARLALIAAAVAIGVALLLLALGSINAFHAQNQRYAWLETGSVGATHAAAAGAGAEHVDPLWWLERADYFDGKLIGRVDVAATGPSSPVPPGIPALPRPGQYYASPAMAKLLQHTPAAQLGDRYPGTQAGIIGSLALPSPDSLIIVVGRDVSSLSHLDAHEVDHISTTSPSACGNDCAAGVGTDSNGMTLVLSVVAAALLFPVLIFIGGATRLSAARREQRFAAMRLVGATPRQITAIATVESSVAAVVGVVVGFGLFLALRPTIATVPFTGSRFFPGDVSLGLADIVIVAAGIPLAAAVAARLALRRVTISPLGVIRRVTPPPPRAWRIAPLVTGIAYFSYLAYLGDIGSGNNATIQALAYLTGVILVMVGLLTAGPWLTMCCSRLVARRTGRPAPLIAARRLSDDPRAAFRAISGVVLAVFVASVAIGAITTIVAYDGGHTGDTGAAKRTVMDSLFANPDHARRPAMMPPAALARLRAIPGVQGVAEIRSDRPSQSGPHVPVQVVSCRQLATTPVLGRCPPGATAATVHLDLGGGVIDSTSPSAGTTWPAAHLSAAALAAIPLNTVVVTTDGSAATETARTLLEQTLPTRNPPQTVSEQRAGALQRITDYRRLANVILLASLPIAGCSLALSVAGGLSERRRPFSLLRLTGVPLGLLRRVVTLEAAVPYSWAPSSPPGRG